MPEILALNDHYVLTLERGYSDGVGTNIKMFMADLSVSTKFWRSRSLAFDRPAHRADEQDPVARLPLAGT